MGRYIRRYIVNVRRVPMAMPKFIAVLTGAQKETVMNYRAEFEGKDVGSAGYGAYHTALYVLTRILKPELVIETGVFHGSSSFSILSALNENDKGYLYSIDVPSSKLPPGKEPGWIVPEHLREKWDLRLGKSAELLPELLNVVADVDLFIHDSKHSYENMYWEYETAWSTIRTGGLLLSHDISRNSAFRDFARHVSEDYAYMLRNLAGIRRTK